MYNPEKLATKGTQDEEKPNKYTRQYVRCFVFHVRVEMKRIIHTFWGVIISVSHTSISFLKWRRTNFVLKRKLEWLLLYILLIINVDLKTSN